MNMPPTTYIISRTLKMWPRYALMTLVYKQDKLTCTMTYDKSNRVAIFSPDIMPTTTITVNRRDITSVDLYASEEFTSLTVYVA